MPDRTFLFAMAGISMSLAGFAGLVSALRRSHKEWREAERQAAIGIVMAIQASVGIGSLANALLGPPWLYELALLLYFLVPAGIFLVFLVSIATSPHG